MISSVKIKNYKSHSNTEIPLTKITLLGGHNNVGKTNLLEALFMLHDRTNPEVVIRQYKFRGIEQFSLDPEIAWAPIFNDFNMDKECSISVSRDKKDEVLSIRYNRSYSRPISISPFLQPGTKEPLSDQTLTSTAALDITYKINGKKVQSSHSLLEQNGVGLVMETNTALNLPRSVFLASRNLMNTSEESMRFGLLDVENKVEPILDILKIMEPRLTAISAISTGNSSIMYGDIGIGRKIPVGLMGDGLSRLLSIVLAISFAKNGIVLIDEIENGIHHSVMSKIWKGIGQAADRYDCQVVATTHSYECLKAAHEGFESATKDFSYIRLDREKNIVVPRKYSCDSLGAALANDWEVR